MHDRQENTPDLTPRPPPQRHTLGPHRARHRHRHRRCHRDDGDRQGLLKLNRQDHLQHGRQQPAGPPRHRSQRRHLLRRRQHPHPHRRRLRRHHPGLPQRRLRRAARPRRAQVVYQDRNWVPQSIVGTTPAYLNVRDWANLTEGDVFGATEVRNASRVCLVGQTIVRELFSGRSPIGQEIRLQSVGFTVVGVLSSKGANAFGQDQDDVIVAPWTTIKYRVAGSSAGGGAASGGNAAATSTSNSVYPGAEAVFPVPTAARAADMPTQPRFANVDQILVSAPSPADIQPAMRQITDLLRERHRIRSGNPDDFSIRDMTEMANTLSATTSMMTNLLLAVALISLVVGGVGIMNIMLVSVTERTREIGLRMAVGARARDILTQFLVEATVLCLLGGIVGLGIGRGTALLVRQFLRWPVEPSVEAIVASIVVSAAVGIVFGFYPAWKASRLDPIDALRYE
ncbi:MAG: ABC transporter permease [Phycisphaerales bacterium]